MQPPDYSGNCIVNLVQSVATACGNRTPRYPELAVLPAERLANARHIVLLVIDGLGANALARLPATSCLREHQCATLQSVFPSTTASAIPTFMSGLAPAQHGLTGWHMYFHEIDQTLAILPLAARAEPAGKSPEDLARELCTYPTLFQHLDRECTVLAPQSIANSAFNAWHSRGATTMAYATVREMFGQMAALLKNDQRSRYLYAYYPDLDTLVHRFGTDSPQAKRALALFDEEFAECVTALHGSDSWLLVTADHGFIDSPRERLVSLDNHPQLAALLERPLCGERRVAYCYVGEENRPAFAAYVRRNLGHCADLRASADLIAAGWFGPPPAHARLAARAGDYTLVMKDHWTITDWLPGEKRHKLLGVHGGISADEMRVPLIALKV